MDSDFNHDPRYLRAMAEAAGECDCVSGSRFIAGGGMDNKARYFLSLMFCRFVRFMTGGRLTDYLFGYYCVKRAALNKCNFDFIFYGFGDYFMRLLACLERQKAVIKEVPAKYGARRGGKSSNKLWLSFFGYTLETLKLAVSIRKKHYV